MGCVVIHNGETTPKEDFIKDLISHLDLSDEQIESNLPYLKSINHAIFKQTTGKMGIRNSSTLGERVGGQNESSQLAGKGKPGEEVQSNGQEAQPAGRQPAGEHGLTDAEIKADNEAHAKAVDEKVRPIADQMVKIENQFNNAGYDLSDDYDSEVLVMDKKTGEQVGPDELPDHLQELAAQYETVLQKLSEHTHEMGKHLQEARQRFNGEDVTHEDVTHQRLPAVGSVNDGEINNAIAGLKSTDAKQKISEALKNKKMAQDNFDIKSESLWDAVHKQLSNDHKIVDQSVLAKAKELRSKIDATNKRLKEQKADMLDQMNEVYNALWGDSEDRHEIEKLHKSGEVNSSGFYPDGWKQRVEDGGYEVNDKDQIVFQVKDDGLFKIHVDNIADGIEEVKKQFPEKVQQASTAKAVSTPKRSTEKQLAENRKNLSVTQTRLENAKENLSEAIRLGDNKMQKVWQDEVDREQRVYEIAKGVNYDKGAIETNQVQPKAYYIAKGSKGTPEHEETVGKPVLLETGLDLFVHERSDDPVDYSVSEGSTGLSIATGDTEQEAIDNAKLFIEKKTPEGLQKIIDKNYEKGIQSPRGRLHVSEPGRTEAVIAKSTATLGEAEAVTGGTPESEETQKAVGAIDAAIAEIDKHLEDEGYDSETGEPKESPEPEPTERERKKAEREAKKEKVKEKLDAAKKAFINSINKATSGLDPEMLAKGLKMIKLYAESGILKFRDIAEDLADEIGDELAKFWDALKASYVTYAASATEDELAEMDDLRAVKKSKITDFLPDYKEPKKAPVEPEIIKEHPFPEEPAVRQAEILQGKLKSSNNLTVDEQAFSNIDLSLLSTPELHKYIELAARLSIDPKNVLTSELNGFFSMVNERINPKPKYPPPVPPVPPTGDGGLPEDEEPIAPRGRIPKANKLPMDPLAEEVEPERNLPDGTRQNYSIWGNLKDIHVRNLEQLKIYGQDIGSMDALREAIKLATSRSQSSVDIKLANDRITRLVGEAGYKALRESLIESRLRGTRQRWNDFARQIKVTSDNEIDDLFEAGKRSPMYSILSDLQGYDGDESPATTILTHLDNGEYDDAREYMSDMFSHAGDNVAYYDKLSNGKTFDEMTHKVDGEVQFRDPKMQEALGQYKQHIEKPFMISHESNDGIFSDALGPLETYYPLTATGTSAHKVYMPSRSKYNAPDNINNHFTTGSADQYSSAIADLSRKLGASIKTNNKATFINALQEAGLMAKVSADSPNDGFISINGIPYPATKVPISDARTIIQNGTAVTVPVRYMLIPNWLHKEIAPIIEGEDDLKGDDHYSIMGHVLNASVNLMLGGPAEAISHSHRLLSAITNSMPYMQEWAYKNGVLGHAGGLILNNLFVKKFTGMGKVLFTNAGSDEFAADVQEMAKLGLIPEKTWTHTYSAEFARSMGVDPVQFPIPYKDIASGEWKKVFTKGKLFDFSPMLYGRNGFDLKARVVMYRLVKAMNPEATPEQHVKMQGDMGQYTQSLQARVEKFIKKHGFGPFATFARTYYRAGFKAVTGTTPLPIDAPNFKRLFSGGQEAGDAAKFMYYKLAQLISSGVLGYIGYWALAHHGVTGKWPWDDKHSKIGKIPITEGMKRNKLIKKYFFNKRTGAYDDLDMSFFNIPMSRGLRATGIDRAYQVHQLGGTTGQSVEASQVEAANTMAGMYSSSALISIPFTTMTGDAPYMTTLRGFTGKAQPGFLKKVNTAPAGLQLPMNFAAGMMGINPLLESLNPASGAIIDEYNAEDYQSGKLMKSIINIAMPGLISPHGSDDKQSDNLHKQAKAIQTTLEKEHHKAKK